ncbi:Beta-glucosidase 12 [Carex littledalei]|uniref:Beta-glucosidase 12 n=1 Tax=Carex littledalei TaxID=544730 RepID=A0A833R3F0_9POAL|nr:Beta-glucosidase 12 [Carex littledalei]
MIREIYVDRLTIRNRCRKDYVNYIDICFKEFGDRVKHWITFNEPYSFCSVGYASGTFAPGRCSPWEAGECSAGNSATEPYICSHNMLLAHSAAVKLYKEKYQGTQRGKIGITIVTHWFLPHSSSKADTFAAKRSLDFMYGWFMDPLTYGDYPVSMRKSVGIRLPEFTNEQSESLKGSYDFLGINYYATYYAISNPISNSLRLSYDTDSQANLTGTSFFTTSWIYIYPPGLQDLMLYTKTNYKNPVIYITENGVNELDNSSLSLKEALNDTIRHGADVRGYFAWSFIDNFEWTSGYTNRFGLYFVEYSNNLARYPKKSAVWFSMFLKKIASPRDKLSFDIHFDGYFILLFVNGTEALSLTL